jgi:hypothetical protein
MNEQINLGDRVAFVSHAGGRITLKTGRVVEVQEKLCRQWVPGGAGTNEHVKRRLCIEFSGKYGTSFSYRTSTDGLLKLT